MSWISGLILANLAMGDADVRQIPVRIEVIISAPWHMECWLGPLPRSSIRRSSVRTRTQAVHSQSQGYCEYHTLAKSSSGRNGRWQEH